MLKVKNISSEILSVPNVGEVEPGEIVEVQDGFHNANFEIVREDEHRSGKVGSDKEKQTNKTQA